MGGILVDYRCGGCGMVAEFRFPQPVPASVACPQCGADARRKFGFRLGAPAEKSESPHASGGHGHGHDHPDGLGTCGLLPTAARALTARLKGDERALEREFKAQERMISEGTLDPSKGVHGLAAQATVPAASGPTAPAAA